MFKSLMAAVFAFAFAYCACVPASALPQERNGSGPPDARRAARLPLKLTVKTDKGAYKVGDTIHITLLLKNPTKAPVPVTFATGQKYDVFIVRPPAGKKPSEIVWQWSLGMMFTQMVTTTAIGAGQTMTYEVKYPPDDGTNPPSLAKGEYTVKGIIATMGRDVVKPEATAKFRVK